MNSPMFDPTMSVLAAYPTRASLRRSQSAASEPATPKPEEIDTVEIETVTETSDTAAAPRVNTVDDVLRDAEQSDAGVAGFSFYFPEAARAVTRVSGR